MRDHARLRVVATHDFCCAYPPSPTSYGSLPGGEGLTNTVDTLRAQGPTVRADAGDFAAPGALATLSDGEAGFAAAADLGIDVGVVGNHEFEWGVEHLRAHAPQTGFPLLCANAPKVGLPPTALVETEGGVVGFVGLTCPDPEVYVSAPSLDPDLTGVAKWHAEDLRASGAQWVVALFHDGVDWRFGPRGYEAHTERFSGVCRPWARSVDAIFASHTLGRWVGRVEGTPVVQPWPFGAELGVVELELGEEPKAYCITPETGERWSGAGSDLLEGAGRTLSAPALQVGRSRTACRLLRAGLARGDRRAGRSRGHARVAAARGRCALLPARRARNRGRRLAPLPLARRHRGRRDRRGRGPEGGSSVVAVAVVRVGLRRRRLERRENRDPDRLGGRRPRARGARLGPPGGVAADGGGAARGRR
jgi:hypothetical protein